MIIALFFGVACIFATSGLWYGSWYDERKRAGKAVAEAAHERETSNQLRATVSKLYLDIGMLNGNIDELTRSKAVLRRRCRAMHREAKAWKTRAMGRCYENSDTQK